VVAGVHAAAVAATGSVAPLRAGVTRAATAGGEIGSSPCVT